MFVLTPRLLGNLQIIWKRVQKTFNVEVHGHIRGDVPVITKTGSYKEVYPDFDVAWKHVTFHTHPPQTGISIEDQLNNAKSAPTTISGPDVAQLLGLNDVSQPEFVSRTELVVGKFGIVRCTSTPAVVEYLRRFDSLTREDFIDGIEAYVATLGILMQFGFLHPSDFVSLIRTVRPMAVLLEIKEALQDEEHELPPDVVEEILDVGRSVYTLQQIHLAHSDEGKWFELEYYYYPEYQYLTPPFARPVENKANVNAGLLV